jgi:hypothetical protein
MQAMQSLIRVPEVAATMRDLSREMMRVRQNTFRMNALGHYYTTYIFY